MHPATEPSHLAADDVVGLLDRMLTGLPVAVELWDGTSWKGAPDPVAELVVHSPEAVRHLLWAPGELGVARAYVTGELDVRGDPFVALAALRPAGARLHGIGLREAASLVGQAAHVAGVAGPPPPLAEEHRVGIARRHTARRDARSVRHHYDVGNDFYRLVLGPSMTYSCARFVDASSSLEVAQASKHELVCRKLGLHERSGKRLLDVGCGWGSLAIHAAVHHGASVVGVTISAEQAALARERVEEAGVATRVEIRVQDYRELRGETFDAISSIGMFEHVGRSQADRYAEVLRSLLGPYGRLLNHAISSPGGSTLGRRSFMGRYVFPDGELLDVADTVSALERAGFEVRDVESLREHYEATLRCWVANLDEAWDLAVELVGERRARIWRLYMVASAVGFADGGVSIHQVLGVVPDGDGGSGMPSTRAAWEA